MAWSSFSTRLIEVLDRQLGRLSRPSQIVKQAAAKGDAMRLLAAAQRDAERIQKGELDIELPPGLSRVPSRPADPTEQLTYAQQITARIEHQELRHEHNLEKIAYYASEEDGDEDVAQEGVLDDEWLTQFFKNAQDVSTDQLQRLWARLLAGEIKLPGSHSIDTIDFMRRMTSARAQQIQHIGPYIFLNKIIVRCDFIDTREWSNIHFWLDLDNLNMIDGVEIGGMTTTYHSLHPERYEQASVYGNKVMICSHEKLKKIVLKCYSLTKIGEQILQLGKFEPDYAYMTSIAHEIKKNGFKIVLGDVVEKMHDGQIRYRNATEIA